MPAAGRNPFAKKAASKKSAATAKKSTTTTGRKSNKQQGAAGKVPGKGQTGMRAGQVARKSSSRKGY